MSPEPSTMTVGGIPLARLIPVSNAGNRIQSRVPGGTIGRLPGIDGHLEPVNMARSPLPMRARREEIDRHDGRDRASGHSRDRSGPRNREISQYGLSGPRRTITFDRAATNPLPQPQAPVPLRTSIPPGWTAWFGIGGRHESERVDGMSESVDDIIGIRTSP